MKKKIISLLLVAVMILSIVPTYALPVFAAECEHVFTEETLPANDSDFWDTHSHDDYYEGSNSFISAQVPAGCLKDGWRLEATDTTGFCMICGEFITEDDKVTLEATGHDFSGTLIDEATCTEAARRECAHNNYEIKVEQDPITGLYSASYISIPCDVIDYSELEEDAALGHDPQEAVLENFNNCEYDDDLEQVVSTNCTEKGTYDSVVYCDRCTAELSRDTLEVEARGHDWDAGRVTTDPTCEEEGVITYTCNYDETHTYTEPIDATGHSYQFVQAVDPTCEEDGHIAYYSCENCDKIFSDDQGTETTEAAIIVEALGHDYNVIDEQEPTCDVPGYKTYECSRCHKQYIEVEQALGHQVDWNIIYNADCENDGLKEGVCSVCHKTLREVIPATGHDYEMAPESVLPGCETYGNIIWVCQNDASHTYREYREPTGHDWQLQREEAATCIEGGYQEFVCKNDASHTYKEYVSDALGHLPKEAVIENLYNCEIDQATGKVVSNTCTEDGSYDLVVYCDRCNAELSRETVDVERLDHIENPPVEENYTNLKLDGGLPVIDPITGEYQVINCNQDGSYDIVVYCDRCGEELSRETVTIAAPGHNWEKQETKYPTCTEEGYNLYTCTRCGESFNEYLAPLGHQWERTDVADCIHGNKFICTREVIDPNTGVVILDEDNNPILCGETYEDDEYNYNLTFTVDSDIDEDEFGYIKYNDANRPAITKDGSNDTGNYKFEIPEEEIPEGADIYISSTGEFDIDYGTDDEGNLLTGHDYTVKFIPARCEYDAYYLVECVREDWDEERYCPEPDADTAENEIFLVVIPNSATGHDWALRDDGSNIDPHCTTDGTRHWYCLNDHNHTYTEKLPATGHNWVLIESIAATCGTDGYEVYQCQNEADDNDLDSDHGDICGEIKTVITAPATGNHTYTVVRHAATCTEDGYDEYTCSVCGYSYQIATTPAKGHNYVVTDTVAATCTTEGYDVYTCKVCGDTYNKTTTHALDHNFMATSFVEPTCSSYGYTVYKCIRCDETFNSDYIPAKEHNFVADVTAPTCTEEGYTTFTCSVCGTHRKDASGEVYKTNITKPVDHVMNTIYTVAPTCGVDGKKVSKCINCAYKQEEVIPATGNHQYDEKVTKNPTCAELGEMTYTCKVCGYSYTEELAKTDDHQYSDVITTAATCGADGVMTHKCDICGEEYTTVIPATGDHQYDEKVTKNPTCAELGEMTYTCKVCGYSYTEELAKTDDHQYSDVITTAATCGADGVMTHKCDICGEEYTTVIPATGDHQYDEKVTKNPTCAELGEMTYTCKVCGYSHTEELAKTDDHQYSDVITTAATCGADGVMTHKCDICGEEYTTVIPATGDHQYDEKVTKNPTCAELGEMTYTCKVCGYSHTEELAKTDDHQYSDVITTAATCVADGVMTHKCDICGEEYTTVIPATGDHQYSDVITTAATCGTDGVMTHKCDICGEEYTTVIPATGDHQYSDVITMAATCVADGVMTHKCDICGEEYTTVIPATGDHKYESVITKQATCMESGIATLTCKECGNVVKEEIPAIGTHSYDAVYNAPTCIDHGYYRYTCKVCGDSYIVETNEPATGHKYVKTVKPALGGLKNGSIVYTCSLCGKKYSKTIAKIKSVTLSQTRFFYSAKNITPLVKVVDANGNVLTTAHYTVTYKNNKAIGTGVVVIKFRGNYTGTMTRYFNIIPKNVGLSNRSSAKGQIKFTWGVVGNCDGYQLQISTNSNFKSAKTININKRGTCVQLLKNLKSGSKYYIRIRAFKIVNNTKVVGNWSACSIKCK